MHFFSFAAMVAMVAGMHYHIIWDFVFVFVFVLVRR